MVIATVIVICFILTIFIYACLVMSGRADEEAERVYQQSKKQDTFNKTENKAFVDIPKEDTTDL